MMEYVKRLLRHNCLTVIVAFTAFLMTFGSIRAYAGSNTGKPYLIKVNRIYNTVTIYEKSKIGQYDIPVKAMLCSVGKKNTETPLGTYTTKSRSRWKLLLGNVWGQYTTRIEGGVLFHSVYYYQNGNPATLATNQFNKLGSAASHGCIRLSVEDAKWIYDNCAVGTTVVIYDDKKSAGPLRKPKAIKISSDVRWDPTDPNKNNPYYIKKPDITGAKSHSVLWGSNVDLLKGVKAESSYGTDITSELVVKGKADTCMAGKYSITYSVTDDLGRQNKKTIIIKVKKSREEPEFAGIKDQVVKEGTVIDKKFALKNVSSSCCGIKLSKKNIEVSIKKVNSLEYVLRYSICAGDEVYGFDTASVYIDREAPTFTGISDRILQPGYIPDQSFALKNVMVTDNYSNMNKGDIWVTIDQIPDVGFQVTYEAQDVLGNLAKETARFIY
jgi:hypothetical protein